MVEVAMSCGKYTIRRDNWLRFKSLRLEFRIMVKVWGQVIGLVLQR